MRSDFDDLMLAHQLDAFIIPPTEGHNPHRDYLTGGVHASGMIIKKRGESPILVVNHMEIDEAQKSGLPVLTFDRFKREEFWKQHGRDTMPALAAWWGEILQQMEIRGRITFYGAADMQYALKLHGIFQRHLTLEGVELVADQTPDIFSLAQQTKDADELAKMREIGQRCSAVMRATRDWLAQQRIHEGIIVTEAGETLTIGAVKKYVRLQLMAHHLDDAEGMIFAQGRDAGVPHSKGEDSAPLKAGEAIVFDLFPREMGGNYYHDMTRTWCLGYAPANVQRDFDLVRDIYWKSLEGITLGDPTNHIATQVCQWFEAAGHPTRLNSPSTTQGYIHALGHGLGMFVHEYPTISHLSPPNTIFQAGHMITIEPGLYYPDQGYGIRIEDTLYLDEAGELQNLTDCPYDLVIEINDL